jgi:hypothetical protein
MEEQHKDPMVQIFKKAMNDMVKKKNNWEENVFNSQQYQQELAYIDSITKDFIDTISTIDIYSTRATHIYDKFLTIHAKNDLIQSAIAILHMVKSGIHNTVKRELRYLVEMMTKYLIVDYDKMGKPLQEKLDYLKDNIPNSSIEIIDTLSMPFEAIKQKEFNDEVKDFFYKACAYVHPSKKQIEEQLDNYNSGATIGFETAKMFSDVNKLVFRAYDMLLAMLFHGFGYSMTGDLFIQVFDENEKWKYHKGKYVKEISKQFNQKAERKRKA